MEKKKIEKRGVSSREDPESNPSTTEDRPVPTAPTSRHPKHTRWLRHVGRLINTPASEVDPESPPVDLPKYGAQTEVWHCCKEGPKPRPSSIAATSEPPKPQSSASTAVTEPTKPEAKPAPSKELPKSEPSSAVPTTAPLKPGPPASITESIKPESSKPAPAKEPPKAEPESTKLGPTTPDTGAPKSEPSNAPTSIPPIPELPTPVPATEPDIEPKISEPPSPTTEPPKPKPSKPVLQRCCRERDKEPQKSEPPAPTTEPPKPRPSKPVLCSCTEQKPGPPTTTTEPSKPKPSKPVLFSCKEPDIEPQKSEPSAPTTEPPAPTTEPPKPKPSKSVLWRSCKEPDIEPQKSEPPAPTTEPPKPKPSKSVLWGSCIEPDIEPQKSEPPAPTPEPPKPKPSKSVLRRSCREPDIETQKSEPPAPTTEPTKPSKPVFCSCTGQKPGPPTTTTEPPKPKPSKPILCSCTEQKPGPPAPTTEPPKPTPALEPPKPTPTTEPTKPTPALEPPKPTPTTDPPKPTPALEPLKPTPTTEPTKPTPALEPPKPTPTTEPPKPTPALEPPKPTPTTEPTKPTPALEPPKPTPTTEPTKPVNTAPAPTAGPPTAGAAATTKQTKPKSTPPAPTTKPPQPATPAPTTALENKTADASDPEKKKALIAREIEKKSRFCNKLRLWDEERYGTKIPKDEVDLEYFDKMRKTGKISHALKYSKEEEDVKTVGPEQISKMVQVDEFTVPKVIDEENSKKEQKKKQQQEDPALLNLRKEKEKELEENMRKVDRRKAFTGMFNDGVRRIDLVIAVTKSEEDPKTQHIKQEFITNIIKHGLEIEIEEGVLPQHAHLLFIKVYAPGKFLQEYAEFFGAKKQFKEKHLEFLRSDSNSFINRTFKLQHEKEWLQLIRLNYIPPLKYSNRERSYITYMVLRCVPFGDHANYFSINRLIEQNIICDVYALHDGPFYYTEDQNFNLVNARQILFYNWLGFQNIFKSQPLTLIHEYFGPKVAFYFAFFEFLNIFLVLPSIVGLCIVIIGIVQNNDVYAHFTKNVCKSDLKVCPRCMNAVACPFEKLKQDCSKLSFLSVFDTIHLVNFAVIICVWAAIFIIYWNRFEKFYIWLWELKLKPRWPTIRTEYYVNTELRRSEYTGTIKRYYSYVEAFKRVMFVRLIMLLLFVIIVMFAWIMLKLFDMIWVKYRDIFISISPTNGIYVAMVLLIMFTILCTNLLRNVFYYISIIATKFENHRTVESYERSLVLKVFTSSAGCTFLMVIYFTFFKGTFYTLPHTNWRPRINITFGKKTLASNVIRGLGELFTTHCGVFGCFDEAMLSFTVLVIGNVLVLRLWRCFGCSRSDYPTKEPKDENAPVLPAWEREYRLFPVTDMEMLSMMTDLIMQFAFVTWFVVLFPLAPIIVLVMNVWFMRNTARRLLLYSRRPVLYNRVGFGAWNGVLSFIAYTSAFTTAVIIAKHTVTITKYTYMKHVRNISENNKWDGLFDNYTFTYFDTEFFKNVSYMNQSIAQVDTPDFCVFPGLYETSSLPKSLGRTWDYERMAWPFFVPFVEKNPGNFRTRDVKYYKNLFELIFIVVFQVSILVLVLVMKYYIPALKPHIKKIMIIEEALKRVYEKNVVNRKKPAKVNPKVTTVATQ